jgi:hypothetical protein
MLTPYGSASFGQKCNGGYPRSPYSKYANGNAMTMRTARYRLRRYLEALHNRRNTVQAYMNSTTLCLAHPDTTPRHCTRPHHLQLRSMAKSQLNRPQLSYPDVDRGTNLAVCYILGCVATFVFVLLRFWVRISIHQLAPDDWWMLIT